MSLENPIEKPAKTAGSGRPTDEHVGQTPPPIPLSTTASQPPSREKNWWDKLKPFVECAGITLLAIYTGFTIAMYFANKKAADAAKSAADTANATLKSSRESFRVEQRPYMVVMPGSIRLLSRPSANGAPLQANISLQNIGRTPAVKIGTYIHLNVYRPSGDKAKALDERIAFLKDAFSSLKQDADYWGKRDVPEDDRMDVAPNDLFIYPTKTTAPLTREDVFKIEYEQAALEYDGIVKYTDASSETLGLQIYETQFCFSYFGPYPSPWRSCATHNVIR